MPKGDANAEDASPMEEIIINSTQYTRYADVAFKVDTHAASWTAYNAFNEDEALEVFWVHVLCSGDAEQTSNIYEALKAWQHLERPQFLRILQVWKREGQEIHLITDSCGRNSIKTYREIHNRLGSPAISKICRQVLRGMMHLVDETELPAHLMTSEDIQIYAADAQVSILPTFIWRTPPESMILLNEAGTTSRAYEGLRSYSAIVLNLQSGHFCQFMSMAQLLEAVNTDTSPDACELLTKCLDEKYSQDSDTNECEHMTESPPSPASLKHGSQHERQHAWYASLLELPFLDARYTCKDSATASPDSDPAKKRVTLASVFLESSLANSIGNFNSPSRHSTADSENEYKMSERFSSVASIGDPTPDVQSHVSELGGEEDLFKCGCVKGLDYSIHASATKSGEVGDTVNFTVLLKKQHSSIRLTGSTHIVQFPFDVKNDTCDDVALEMAPLFEMEETDTGLTAAAMREVLAQTVPGFEDWRYQSQKTQDDDRAMRAHPANHARDQSAVLLIDSGDM